MTGSRCTVIDLTAPDQPWRAVRIPGSDRDVRLVRLHVDHDRGSSVSLVEFPAGWQRPEVGHYLCAEEFVVLRGAITVGEHTSGQGDYALLPAGTPRTSSATPTGCLALAAFSGVPTWVSGRPDPAPGGTPRHAPAHQADRSAGPEFPGAARAGAPPTAPLDRSVDLLSLPTGRWAYLPAGQMPPDLAGPVLMRCWP